jgi:hypothetical protein
VTFGRPAIWVRDSATETMTAYGLPSGGCVLPTRLRVTVRDGQACATLRRAEVDVPVASQRVTVAGSSVTTGADGVACADIPATPGQHRVDAVFGKTRSWAASAATTSYVVAGNPPAKPRHVPSHHVVRRVAHIPNAAPPAPLPAAAAPPAPPHPPAPQPAPQPGYGTSAVSQAVPLGAAVPEQARAAQLAYVTGDHDTSLAGAQLLAATMFAAAAGAATRRRSAPAYARRP